MFGSPTSPRRLRRGYRARAAALLMFLVPAAIVVPAHARPVSRDDVVRLVRAAPTAMASQQRAAGYQEAAEASSLVALDNPQISAAGGPRVEQGATTLALAAGITVPVDLFGQRATRREAANAEARAAAATARGATLAPLRNALLLHAETLAARTRRELLLARIRLAEELTEAATRRKQAGEVTETDVALARLQLARERAATSATEGEIEALELRLAAELGLSPGERAEAEGPLVPTPSPQPRASEAPNVVVAVAEAEEAAARARLHREEARGRPTVSFLANYQLDAEAHIWTAGFALPIPLYGTTDATVAVARGEAGAAGFQAAAVRQLMRGALQAARARTTSTGLALEQLRPAARDARGIVLRQQRAYAAGESDLPTLLLVRREALDAELSVVDAELAHASATIEADLLEGRWSR